MRYSITTNGTAIVSCLAATAGSAAGTMPPATGVGGLRRHRLEGRRMRTLLPLNDNRNDFDFQNNGARRGLEVGEELAFGKQLDEGDFREFFEAFNDRYLQGNDEFLSMSMSMPVGFTPTPAPSAIGEPTANEPTTEPTTAPTSTPTPAPSVIDEPTFTQPTNEPTATPTTASQPTTKPTTATTITPTQTPSAVGNPTFSQPTTEPTTVPSPLTPAPSTNGEPTSGQPTTEPTDAPSPDPLPTPTAGPTRAPTDLPITIPPTLSPTASSTAIPTATPERAWWMPKASDMLTWQWQLQDVVDDSFNVSMYDIDLFDNTAEFIALLKAQGRTVVCYFSAGSYEAWRPDWAENFDFISVNSSYSGNEPPFAGNLSGWDERWLDIRRIDLLEDIMRGRFQMAKEKGCDAVEPDNVDAYSNGNETGLNLTYDDQLVYNRWLANESHAIGMSIGLKNDVDQLADLEPDFDWALNEECYEFDECGSYSDTFVAKDKAVFGVEYKGDPADFCPTLNEMSLSWLKKNLNLTAFRIGCEDY